jgi:hypothetical protein
LKVGYPVVVRLNLATANRLHIAKIRKQQYQRSSDNQVILVLLIETNVHAKQTIWAFDFITSSAACFAQGCLLNRALLFMQHDLDVQSRHSIAGNFITAIAGKHQDDRG